VAGSPSSERRRRALSPAERIAGAGAIAVFASLLFPWYGIAFGQGLSVTGLDRFGFGHAALLITVAAAAYLVVREASGHGLPRPLRAAELVAVAGAWGALLCFFLIGARPDELAGRHDVQLRYGIFVALGGCLVILVGGLRMRVEREPGK
jgi:hypothetical protein